jgi:hypothetical protein
LADTYGDGASAAAAKIQAAWRCYRKDQAAKRWRALIDELRDLEADAADAEGFAPLLRAAQPASAVPQGAAAPAARTDEYWQRLAVMRDKYTTALHAAKAAIVRMSSASGAAGDTQVLRTVDEQLLPLLCSTPASPAPDSKNYRNCCSVRARGVTVRLTSTAKTSANPPLRT